MNTYTKTKNSFAERLLKARVHAGMSQKELITKVGMAQSTYSKLEQEGHGSSYTAQIAEACGVSILWLAAGTGDMLDAEKPFRSIPLVDPLADTRELYGRELIEMLSQFKERTHLTVMFARLTLEIDSYRAELLSTAQPEPHEPTVERRRQDASAPTQQPARHP